MYFTTYFGVNFFLKASVRVWFVPNAMSALILLSTEEILLFLGRAEGWSHCIAGAALTGRRILGVSGCKVNMYLFRKLYDCIFVLW